MGNVMNDKKTFKYDNVLIEKGPEIFSLQNRPTEQLFLPGLNKPLPPSAEWVVISLYALLDPDNPTAPIRTTPTEILEILDFARSESAALGGKTTYTSDQYKLIYENLDLLYNVEINFKGEWDNYIPPGEKKRRKDKGNGKPKKPNPFVFRGRILSSYTLVYPPDVTPPEILPEDEVINISRSKTGHKILKRKDARPIGIELQLDPRLVAGLTGEGPNIGATILPLQLIQRLHTDYPKNPTLRNLAKHVLRQTSQTMTNQDLKKLVKRLGLEPRRKGKNRDDLYQYFTILQSYGAIKSFSFVEDASGNVKYSFTKSKAWCLEKQLDQGQEEALIIDGEEVKKE